MDIPLPELISLNAPRSVIRIAYQQDVPITPRISELIDTPSFQHLKGLSQLGLVSMVYPSANHTRFEHSLGVYHLALRYLRHFLGFPQFAQSVTLQELEAFVLAALLHDIGHWPYCHPLEDMQLKAIPSHETRATHAIQSSDLANTITASWSCTPLDVARFLTGDLENGSQKLLYSMLSSPVDIDKMDYLQRDSLHAGVPYGRNYDQQRLLSGLIPDFTTHQLAVHGKSLTAAEMMVFARYVMFSEVYWHKAVRSATAMLQRSVYELPDNISLDPLFQFNDWQANKFIERHSTAKLLTAGLFAGVRRLHKCVFQCNASNNPEVFHRVAEMSYANLVAAGTRLQDRLGISGIPHAVLIDAPPNKLEVQFDLNVVNSANGELQPLSVCSPVVRALATEQFDYHVKRVRIFVTPEMATDLSKRPDLAQLLLASLLC